MKPSLKHEFTSVVRLIINESLTVGSQIEYINRAHAAGYAVIVTNTNLNGIESPRQLRHSKIRPIRVSKNRMNRKAIVMIVRLSFRAVTRLKSTVLTFGKILFKTVQSSTFVLWLILMVVLFF